MLLCTGETHPSHVCGVTHQETHGTQTAHACAAAHPSEHREHALVTTRTVGQLRKWKPKKRAIINTAGQSSKKNIGEGFNNCDLPVLGNGEEEGR